MVIILLFFMQAKLLVSKRTSRVSPTVTFFKNSVVLPLTLLLVTIFRLPFTAKNLIVSTISILRKSMDVISANPSSIVRLLTGVVLTSCTFMGSSGWISWESGHAISSLPKIIKIVRNIKIIFRIILPCFSAPRVRVFWLLSLSYQLYCLSLKTQYNLALKYIIYIEFSNLVAFS